ncbi:MAG: restriction endonuclease [Deltaproteobacteria bacterium]|nr:restriction endonuclease [Deltaproteobacteria bacterium]
MGRIELTEYRKESIPKDELPRKAGEYLWRSYRNVLSVEPPSFKTENSWQLTPEGWVGHIPLPEGPSIYLSPRVELSNLFRMWEYAYRLERFNFLDGMVGCDSLEDFYENIAGVLAGRVLDRGRKGFYRTYLPETDMLPFLRGRMDTKWAVTRPWEVTIRCHYEEHTGDIDENRILAWTLRKIARSGICRAEVRGRVRRAYRVLRSFVDIQPFCGNDCVGRFYNRLNTDYQPLHALCRFFLESSGPTHEIGDRDMIPFLVYMPALFELFVAEWMRVHLPHGFTLKPQHGFKIDEAGNFRFIPDLVIYDRDSNGPCCVLDTKYKVPDKPGSDDIAKVAAYALGLDCTEAVLVYPSAVIKGIDTHIGSVHVRSVCFGLEGDIEEQGKLFLEQIL